MSLALLIQGVGSMGVFAARAFLPAFATALLLRFGPHLPLVAQSGLIARVGGVPTWFTSDAALVILGLLSALELAAGRSAEARAVLDEIHGSLKAGMAALTYLGVLGATDRGAVGSILRAAGLLDVAPAAVVGAGTLLVARVRSAVLGPLGEADEDDDLGLQRLLRRAGDAWGLLGPAALLVFPLLTVAAFGVAAGLLVWLERRVGAAAERLQVACPSCGAMHHAGARVCPGCQAPADAPRAVGLLGRPKAGPADPATLPFDLVAVRRCPACATRFRRGSARPTCSACGLRPLDDPTFAAGYVAAIDRRVPLACAVGLGLGLIPVFGVVPGVIHHRLAVVAPFRRYLPPGAGFRLRWGVRLAGLVLVAFQWVPVVGALAIPALGLISYGAYRAAYRRLALAPLNSAEPAITPGRASGGPPP